MQAAVTCVKKNVKLTSSEYKGGEMKNLRTMIILTFFVIFIANAVSGPSEKSYDITAYGAVSDSTALNTEAIQQAIDACAQSGGGKVVFPRGQYLSGTIVIKDNVTLCFEKGALLLGSTNLADYKNVDPFTEGLGIDVGWALVVAVDAKNIGIEGEGAIDGQGSALKARHILTDTRPEAERWGLRPFLLRVVRCENVTVKDITLKYAGAWTSHYFQCKNLQIENVKIISYGVAHNDGIGIDGCQHVRISHCDIESGDDALVFKTTSSKMACRDVIVKGMRLKSRQAGIKTGTESMAPFEDIKISDCYIYETRNGGIKLNTVDGAHLRNVEISDITMIEVRTPMLFRLGSRLNVFRKDQDMKQETGTFENVTIRNVKAQAAAEAQLKPPTGILITGVPDHYITNLTLENITISLAGGGTPEDARHEVPEAADKYPEVKTFGPKIPAYGVWARHVKGLKLNNVVFTLDSADVRPAIIIDDGQNIEINQARLPVSAGAESVIRLENVTGGIIRGVNAAGDARSFVLIEGENSSGIRLSNNMTEGVQKTVSTSTGAGTDAAVVE